MNRAEQYRSAHPPFTASTELNPYLQGNFAPVETETTALDLQVKGHIPAELEGRLLRNGPNPVGTPDPNYHWFSGSGMVHGVRLRGGRAEWYRNRFVVSDDVALALGRPPLPGPRNPARPDSDNKVNTSVLSMGGRTYGTVEAGGLPIELTCALDSVARSDFDHTLKFGFAAHPKLDPITGELHVLTYEPELEFVSYLVVGKDGRSRNVADIFAPHRPMVHDVAFTASKVIVLDLPVNFDPAMGGKWSFPFSWHPDRPARVGLLPRSGDLSGLRWVEAPTCFVFHIMNAYDDGEGTVVVDVARHPRSFDRERRGPSEGDPKLARWRIDLSTGKLTEALLDERPCEFPRFNDAYGGRNYRFGYTASFPMGQRFGATYKHDLTQERLEVHDYGPGRAGQEPVFVAREGARAEDDGWVMSYVYDRERNASDVVILDARAFADEPVATIALPVRVPFGFHGNWVPDRMLADRTS